MTNSVSTIGRFAITPEWLLDLHLSPTAYYAWAVAWAKYVDRDDAHCRPSHKAWADACEVSISTLQRAIRELVSAGALAVVHRFAESGDKLPNDYVFHVERPDLQSEKTGPLQSNTTGPPVTNDRRTIISDPESVEPESGDPSGRVLVKRPARRPVTIDEKKRLMLQFKSLPDVEERINRAMAHRGFTFTSDKVGFVEDWLTKDLKAVGNGHAKTASYEHILERNGGIITS